MPTPLFEILDRWSVADLDELLDPGSAEAPMQAFSLAEAHPWFVVAGKFRPESRIWLPADAAPIPPTERLRINGTQHPQDCELILRKPAPHISLQSGARQWRVFIGQFGFAFRAHVNMWRRATLLIGDGATSNDARIIVDEAEVRIGRDCMFSDGVVLQSNDQHGIVDVASGALLNAGAATITLGEHVWLGRRSMVLPNVRVGSGSIVAAGAVVTAEVPPNSVAAGVPARLVRSGTTWSREPGQLDRRSGEYLSRAQGAG